MSSIVLDNSLDTLFSLINAVADESLAATPIWSSWPAETRSVDWVERTLRLSSTTALMNDEWKQRLEAVIKDNGAVFVTFHILRGKVVTF